MTLKKNTEKCSCIEGTAIVLPFAVPPPLATYNYMAFLTGALLGSSSSRIHFIFNNYIQLSSASIYSDSHFLSFVPALGVDNTAGLGGRVSTHQVVCHSECESTIANGLQMGHYARVVLDEYYIPDTPAFRKTHFIHDNMIIGYCPYCRTCWSVGYRNKDGELPSFGVSRCALSDIAIAICSRPNGAEPKYLQDVICLFSPGDLGTTGLDIPHIKQQLIYFLYGDHDSEYFLKRGYDIKSATIGPNVSNNVQFGIKIYNATWQKILRCIESGDPLDMRIFRLLWEHKIWMTKRVKALAEAVGNDKLSGLLSKFELGERMANVLRLSAVQYELDSHHRKAGFLRRYLIKTGPLWEIARAVKRLEEHDKNSVAALVDAI